VTIEVSTTDKRDGRALALFARHTEWQQGKTKDGRSFFAIPGSEPGLYHLTDARDCSCPDRQQRQTVCKHMRAVRLWLAAYATGAVSPKRGAGGTLEDDQIILTPEGAAYLVEADAPVAARASYADLFPSCRAQGCQDDPEPRERYCGRHVLVDAF
jgi:hypothetical protein